jgi:hypothetical protein
MPAYGRVGTEGFFGPPRVEPARGAAGGVAPQRYRRRIPCFLPEFF